VEAAVATAERGIGGRPLAAGLRRRAQLPAPLAPTLLDTPLDYILADHMRQRAICAVLKEVRICGEVARDEAMRIVTYLREDLPLHHADEDEGLFPALRRRALPEDDLDAVLARLGEDHRRGELLVDAIISGLTPSDDSDVIVLSPQAQGNIEAYASGENLHLAIENAVVMVIARVRLHRNDLKALSEAMKRRRQVGVS
jgi:hemerythrin-like domain-containing protein